MPQKIVLLIGGAGAQGVPIVQALSSDPNYAVRVLTRDTTSPTALALSALPNVTLFRGDASTEPDLRAAFKGTTHAFVNTNSFALGIRSEIYWGMRIYEIAVQSGVAHYVYSSLPDATQLSGYDETCRVGHFEGKSRVAQWMAARPQSPMAWSIVTTGPYVEMLHELLRPEKEADGTWVFRYPLKEGAVPFVHLDDIGKSVKWLFDHLEEAKGLDLQTTVEHASGEGIAEAFTKVTGQKARYESIETDDWLDAGGPGPRNHKVGSGHPGNTPDDPTLQTIGENFGNWWNVYQRSAGNTGLLKTDYEWLDRNMPDRVKSVEEWMRKVGYTGERRTVLQQYGGR